MATFKAPDGASLFYTDEGAGLPLVMLSGLTRNGTDFDYLVPHLNGVRIVRLDYRGRGKSDWTGAATYTVPTESADVVALLDHLGVEKAAVLGTSRGGLVAMVLAATAKHRLMGVCLNDIGPELMTEGLESIFDYIGRNPSATTFEDAAKAWATHIGGFANVPDSRWMEEVERRYKKTPEGLVINYDSELRTAVLAANESQPPDLWPLFDAFAGLPLALIRGANSDLLSRETADAMAARRPDMIRADVPDRGHVPFLDEPEALSVIREWLEQLHD